MTISAITARHSNQRAPYEPGKVNLFGGAPYNFGKPDEYLPWGHKQAFA
jgi:hypothetical protein